MAKFKKFKRFMKRLKCLRLKQIPRSFSKLISKSDLTQAVDFFTLSKIQIKIINSLRKLVEFKFNYLSQHEVNPTQQTKLQELDQDLQSDFKLILYYCKQSEYEMYHPLHYSPEISLSETDRASVNKNLTEKTNQLYAWSYFEMKALENRFQEIQNLDLKSVKISQFRLG